jgi:hypothetical protein
MPDADTQTAIDQFSPGDEIQVSARETPMTVKKVREPDNIEGVLEVVAENRYGSYLVRETDDGTLVFKRKKSGFWGAAWSYVESPVEVDHA